MSRFVKAAASLAELLVLVLGLPLALWRLGRLDALTEVRWSDLVGTADTGGLLLALMTVAGWVAWLVLLASVVAEVVGVLTRGRVHVRVPGGGWVQPLVAALVVGVLGSTTAPIAASAAAPSPVTVSAPVRSVPAAPVSVPDQATADESAHSTQGEVLIHVVEAGDDLWSLAEKYYGDGTRWRAIAEQNQLDDPNLLPVGLRLRLTGLPSGEAAEQSSKTAAHAASVTVEQGDTLASLAARHLGDADRWPEIHRLNRAVVSDPDLIQPGWKLMLPATDDRQAPAPQRAEPSRNAPAGQPGGTPAQQRGTPTKQQDRSDDGRASDSAQRPGTAEQGPSSQASAGVTEQREESPGSVAEGTAPAQESRAAQTPPASGSSSAAEPGQGTELPSGRGTDEAAGSSRTSPPVQTTAADEHQETGLDDPALASVAALGTLLAAALSGALLVRRRHQLAQRALGRRVVLPGPQALHLEAAVAQRAAEASEPLDAAPTAILLGTDASTDILHDLEAAGTTVITGSYREGLLSAVTTGLVLQPWSAETRVVAAGGPRWLLALDEPQVSVVDAPDALLVELERTVALRRVELGRARMADGSTTLASLREDPDRWEAWAPMVFVLPEALDEGEWRRVESAMAGQPVGVSVLAVADRPREGASHVQVDAPDQARLDGRTFLPSLMDPEARRGLVELFETSSLMATTPAHWWSDDDDLPPNLAVLPHRATHDDDEEVAVDPSEPVQDPTLLHATELHPTLLLLGPIDLVGCRGEEPPRARRQCIEYCAWLQTNPGATASRMARELLVAEGTRRSNMSRLRSWLGSDPQGELYLPDAYSGRIQLHPGITTDWEQLQLLVGPGVNRCSTNLLVEALQMVRGAPLADAAPGQWHWAEEMRTDMCSVVRDIGVVLARRAVEEQDLDLGRWAVNRALVAAPGDELLLGARVRIEHLAGNRPEVDRLVLQLTRQARNTGVDLADETVVLLQEVMEGRRRALA
ncbi:LysM peptidoglycan-binding domain-containing protein [Luteococcus peritonei]|uniref:LysM peptidoglycan-binding domain-containing protein n=1 Tax=Luteococcus peritonei TaxID=88874 RepID=A0ABW4RTE9_9ACTN